MEPQAAVKQAYGKVLSDRNLNERSELLESSFGCGGVVPWANLQAGERILDLGSGAGSDCVQAAFAVGSDGLVVGVDFTPQMVTLASARARHLELGQIHVAVGDIRALPLAPSQFDVVISNCTLNLVTNRSSPLAEAFRALRPGGRFLLSEVVLNGTLSEQERTDTNLFLDCIAGATSLSNLIQEVEHAGFVDVTPVRVGALHGSPADYDMSSRGIWKVTSVLLRARKPAPSSNSPKPRATRVLILGASEAAIATARHHRVLPTVLAKLGSAIPALDAFDVVPFDGSPEDALRKCLELYEPTEVCGVVAFDGPYVESARILSQHFGGDCHFPAQLVEGGENKLAARQAMARAGVPVPLFWFGTDLREAEAWAQSVGWPIVAKPVNDANSRMVRLCHDGQELASAFGQILSTSENIGGGRLIFGVLLEEFVAGREFSVEIIAPAHNPPIVATVCEKLLGPEPFFVEIGHAIPPSLRAEALASLKSTAINSVRAIGVSNLICHVEVRLGDRGPVIIEANLRPPGGRLPDLIRRTSGWDLPRAAVQLACGLPLCTDTGPCAPCGIYHCITTECEAVIDFEMASRIVLEGTRYPPFLEMDVYPGATVYPVNHPRGQILGRILAFGDRPSEAWDIIRKIKRSINLTFAPLSPDHEPGTELCSGCWEKGCC